MPDPTILCIPLDQIGPSPYQPRKNFDPDKLKAFAVSLEKEGQLQPILVRRISSPQSSPSRGDHRADVLMDDGLASTEHRSQGGGDGGVNRGDPPPQSSPSRGEEVRYEIISGERRWRATQLLGLKTIEAKVIETVSEAAAAAKGMVENLQREDLDPIEEAEGLNTLAKLDPGYWTQDQIAKITGKTQSHVSETMRFLSFSENLKGNIRQRIISPEHGAELLRLPTSELQDKVAGQIVNKGLTVIKTRNLVNSILQHKTAPYPAPSTSKGEGGGGGETAKKTGRPLKDPLASLWPKLLADGAINPAGSWTVAFKKEKWNFAVDVAPASLRPGSMNEVRLALAAWFHQMADALAGTDQEGNGLSQHTPESIPTPEEVRKILERYKKQ
jgi:ParB family chromosome partitioning protein